MVSSLQKLCEVSIAIWIANIPEVKEEIFNSSSDVFKHAFEGYEGKRIFGCNGRKPQCNKYKNVLQKGNKIFANYPPIFLSSFPSFLIPLIGSQMLKWAEFLHSNFDVPLKISCKIISGSIFTSEGTINEEKAARKLLKESSLDACVQYKIASYYFLEDIISPLWKQLRYKKDFKKMLNSSSSEAWTIWNQYLEGKEKWFTLSRTNVTDRFLINAFNYGIEKNNLAAVKYSWNLMTLSRKLINYENWQQTIRRRIVDMTNIDESIYKACYGQSLYAMVYSFPLEKFLDIFKFFIVQAKDDEMKQFLTINFVTYDVLRWFLSWPNQHLFLDVVDYFWESLDDEDNDIHSYSNVKKFYKLIQIIVKLIADPHLGETFNYRVLLRELWIKSPSKFKIAKDLETNLESRYDYSCINIFLLMLTLIENFTTEDKYNFRLILESLNAKQKSDLLNYNAYNICQILVDKNKLMKIDFFLECLNMNKDIVKKFKKNLGVGFFLRAMQCERETIDEDEIIPDWAHVHILSESIDQAESIVNWAIGASEFEDSKNEIFSAVFKSCNTEHMLVADSGSSFGNINKFLKWFLCTDDKVEEYKKSILLHKYNLHYFSDAITHMRCHQLLEWIGYSEGNEQIVKKKILFKSVPYTISMLFKRYTILSNSYLMLIILGFCSEGREEIYELVSVLREMCKGLSEENMNLEYQINVRRFPSYTNQIKSFCLRRRNEVFSTEDLETVYSVVKQLTDFFSKNEKKEKLIPIMKRLKKKPEEINSSCDRVRKNPGREINSSCDRVRKNPGREINSSCDRVRKNPGREINSSCDRVRENPGREITSICNRVGETQDWTERKLPSKTFWTFIMSFFVGILIFFALVGFKILSAQNSQ